MGVRAILAGAAATLLLLAATASAAVPDNAIYEQAYFPSGDGTVLHAAGRQRLRLGVHQRPSDLERVRGLHGLPRPGGGPWLGSGSGRGVPPALGEGHRRQRLHGGHRSATAEPGPVHALLARARARRP